jgi:hypothetical protein
MSGAFVKQIPNLFENLEAGIPRRDRLEAGLARLMQFQRTSAPSKPVNEIYRNKRGVARLLKRALALETSHETSNYSSAIASLDFNDSHERLGPG